MKGRKSCFVHNACWNIWMHIDFEREALVDLVVCANSIVRIETSISNWVAWYWIALPQCCTYKRNTSNVSRLGRESTRRCGGKAVFFMIASVAGQVSTNVSLENSTSSSRRVENTKYYMRPANDAIQRNADTSQFWHTSPPKSPNIMCLKFARVFFGVCTCWSHPFC